MSGGPAIRALPVLAGLFAAACGSVPQEPPATPVPPPELVTPFAVEPAEDETPPPVPPTAAAPAPPVVPAPGLAAPRHPALADGDLGGWEPSGDLVEAALRFGDARTRAAAATELTSLPADRRLAILRAGIRLREPIAAGTCALLAPSEALDTWEAARSVPLAATAILDPAFLLPDGSVPGFSAIMMRMTGSDLTPILERIEGLPPQRLAAIHLETIHRVARPEHLPAAAALTLSADPTIRRFAWDLVRHTGHTTDRHRDDIAAATLGLPLDEARRRHPQGRGALSPLLVAVLEQEMRGQGNSVEWMFRWLADSEPAADDLGFLVRLGRSSSSWRHVSRQTVPWLIGRIDSGGEWFETQRQRFEGDPSWVGPAPLAALARRGYAPALDELVRRAASDGNCLAALLAIDPPRARALVEKIAFGPDDASASDVLLALRHASEVGFEGIGLRWEPFVFAGFEEGALAASLDGWRLALVGISAPGCRTRLVAAAAIAAMDARHAPAGLRGDAPVTQPGTRRDVLAFLETGAPGAFRARVVQWARSDDAPTRDVGLAAAFRIGVPELGAELVAWMETDPKSFPDARVVARSASAAVREHLEAVATGRRESAALTRPDALAALAVYDGLPEEIEFREMLADRAVADDLRREAERLVLDGRPRDALAALLGGGNVWRIRNLSLVDDPRVRAHLAGLRSRRESFAAVSGELALMGDAAARAEIERVLRSGLWERIDRLSDRAIVLGDVDAWIPHWIDLLESNCCLSSTISFRVCREILDWEELSPRGESLARSVRRAWDRAGGHFVRTRFSDKPYAHVAAPR